MSPSLSTEFNPCFNQTCACSQPDVSVSSTKGCNGQRFDLNSSFQRIEEIIFFDIYIYVYMYILVNRLIDFISFAFDILFFFLFFDILMFRSKNCVKKDWSIEKIVKIIIVLVYVVDFFGIVSSKYTTKESRIQVAWNVIALNDIPGFRARNVQTFYNRYLPYVMIIP